ncbi:MAG: hypothetical protein ABH864_05210 [archaeon]
MKEKKCYKNVYRPTGRGLFQRVRQEIQCPKPKQRCRDGVLAQDIGDRKAGSPCKDSGDYS